MTPRARGIALSIVSSFVMVLHDAISKLLILTLGSGQILALRCAIALPLVALIAHGLGQLRQMMPRTPRLFMARGMISLAASLMIIWSLTVVPFAEAVVLISSAPIFTCFLSPLLLGERASAREWLAVAIGFLGAVLIVKPLGASFTWASLLPLAAATVLACQDLLTRYAVRTESGLSLLTATLLMTSLGGAAFGLVEGFTAPSAIGWLLLIGAGGLAAIGFLTQILAFKVLTATELAPLRYTALVWAVLLGWILWSEFPDLLSLIGGVLVVIAGLMVIKAPAQR